MNQRKISRRITAKKHEGDDYASWAVFIDGKPWITGLTRTEVPYYKEQAQKKLNDLEEARRLQMTNS